MERRGGSSPAHVPRRAPRRLPQAAAAALLLVMASAVGVHYFELGMLKVRDESTADHVTSGRPDMGIRVQQDPLQTTLTSSGDQGDRGDQDAATEEDNNANGNDDDGGDSADDGEDAPSYTTSNSSNPLDNAASAVRKMQLYYESASEPGGVLQTGMANVYGNLDNLQVPIQNVPLGCVLFNKVKPETMWVKNDTNPNPKWSNWCVGKLAEAAFYVPMDGPGARAFVEVEDATTYQGSTTAAAGDSEGNSQHGALVLKKVTCSHNGKATVPQYYLGQGSFTTRRMPRYVNVGGCNTGQLGTMWAEDGVQWSPYVKADDAVDWDWRPWEDKPVSIHAVDVLFVRCVTPEDEKSALHQRDRREHNVNVFRMETATAKAKKIPQPSPDAGGRVDWMAYKIAIRRANAPMNLEQELAGAKNDKLRKQRQRVPRRPGGANHKRIAKLKGQIAKEIRYKHPPVTIPVMQPFDAEVAAVQKQIYEKRMRDMQKEEGKETTTTTTKPDPIRIVWLGLESLSRLRFLRQMPLTASVLTRLAATDKEKLAADYSHSHVSFLFGRYHATGGHTEHNLIPMFSPSHSYFDLARVTKHSRNINGDWLPDVARRLGFVVHRSQDGSSILPPMVASSDKCFVSHHAGQFRIPKQACARPHKALSPAEIKKLEEENQAFVSHGRYHKCPCEKEMATQESLQYMVDAVTNPVRAYRKLPLFAYHWCAAGHGPALNAYYTRDELYADVLEKLMEHSAAANTVIILAGDHGYGYDPYGSRPAGAVEKSLPALGVLFPKGMMTQNPDWYRHLFQNQARLMGPADLGATMRCLAHYPQPCPMPAISKAALSVMHGLLPRNRTCSDLRISSGSCTCHAPDDGETGMFHAPATAYADIVMDYINEAGPGSIAGARARCLPLQFVEVVASTTVPRAIPAYKELSTRYKDWLIGRVSRRSKGGILKGLAYTGNPFCAGGEHSSRSNRKNKQNQRQKPPRAGATGHTWCGQWSRAWGPSVAKHKRVTAYDYTLTLKVRDPNPKRGTATVIAEFSAIPRLLLSGLPPRRRVADLLDEPFAISAEIVSERDPYTPCKMTESLEKEVDRLCVTDCDKPFKRYGDDNGGEDEDNNGDTDEEEAETEKEKEKEAGAKT